MVYQIGDEEKLLVDRGKDKDQEPLNSEKSFIPQSLPIAFSLNYGIHKNLEFDFQVLTGEISGQIDLIFPEKDGFQ